MPLSPLNLTDTLKADNLETCATIRRHPEMIMAMCKTPADWACEVFVPILRPSKDQTGSYESI